MLARSVLLLGRVLDAVFARGPFPLLQDQVVAVARDPVQPAQRAAGSGRNEPPDDHVLLEALERIGLAVDGGVGEHAGRLLERGGGDERAGLERGLGDAEQYGLAGGGLAARRLDRRVGVLEVDAVHLLAFDELGGAGIVSLDLLQHLPDDHLDMLVVDGDALQPVYLLDLVHEVIGQLFDALDGEDVVRRGVAVEQVFALLDAVAILHGEMPALGDQVLDRLLAVLRHDGDAPLVLVVAAELHRAGDVGDDGMGLGPPRFEQLGDARQAAGDVAGLGALGRNTGEHVAGHDLMAGLHRQDGIDGQEVAGFRAARELGDLALLVLDHHRGPEIGAARRCAPVDDHAVGDAGRFVAPLADRHSLDQILEVDRALDFGEHRTGIGIPLGEPVAAFDPHAVIDPEMRAVRQTVQGALGSVLVEHDNGRVAFHDHEAALRIRDHVALLDLHRAVEIRLQRRLIDDLGGRHAAEVERAHGELRAGLADRLRGDDADSFAEIDRRAAGEIAPVALGTDAVAGFAGQDRADADLLHARLLERIDLFLLDQLAGLDDHLAGRGILDVLGGGAAEHALAERHRDLARLPNGASGDAVLGAAILFSDDAVLRHVDQAPSEIAGVRGLQRRIGQALAGAVSRVEVLEHR